MVFYVYAKGNMAGDCAALGLWIYLRDSRLLNITQNAGFFGSIEEQKIFCKSKVSVRKIYSGTKDSHDVMSWESFCTMTGVVHNGCYSYRLPPKGLKELVLTYEL